MTLKVVQLLGRRMQLAKHIGDLKHLLGEPVLQSSLEVELRAAMYQEAKLNGLSEGLVAKLSTLLSRVFGSASGS